MPAPRKKFEVLGPSVPHEICWAKTTPDGKPGIPVREHCLNVGCVAEALVELLPARLRTLLPFGVGTLAALHDVGKISPGFQVKCAAWLSQHALSELARCEAWAVRVADHAMVSQATAQHLLGRPTLHPWAAILGAHHGKIKGERVQSLEPSWEEERFRLAKELIETFGSLPDRRPHEATLWLVAGLVTVADWIGSDENRFPQDARWGMSNRRERARAALKEIGWGRPAIIKGLPFGELFPHTPQPNSLQVETSRAVRSPGVYIIEGPMGFGKTEAALVAAYQLIEGEEATGLYFALPTRVTSNRIHLRVQPFVERIVPRQAHVQLVHSASWLLDNEGPPRLLPSCPDAEGLAHMREGRSWFASAKRALLAPYGVGTIDQSLLGIVAANHFFVRQFGLAGKVVILDEVHSYDLYTSTLVSGLIARLRELECTVIVLSATLTQERRRHLLGLPESADLDDRYPLLSGRTSDGRFIQMTVDAPPPRTVAVRFMHGDELVERSLKRARRGQSVLWIRNTVDEAQDTYCLLKAANYEGGPAIGLLHSRFPYFRREQLEAHWLEALGKDWRRRSPDGCVLVSTQVAEQSVDIDADLLVTDLAPTDMLLQRLGRLWRHERPSRLGRPEIWIREPGLSISELQEATVKRIRDALGKSARVYAPYVLLRSLSEWRVRDAITLPTEIRGILESTYAPPAHDESTAWRELLGQMEQQKAKLEALALSATNVWAMPALPDDEGVQTRYNTYPMAPLLLATEIVCLDSHSAQLRLLDGATVKADDRHWNFETAKAIHRNIASVPQWAVASQIPNSPGWLANYVSQPAALGRLQSDGCVFWLSEEVPSGLSYQPDQGILIRREHALRIPQEEWDESYD